MLKVIWPRQKLLLDCLVVVLCSEQGDTDNLKVITASSLSNLNILKAGVHLNLNEVLRGLKKG